VVKTIEHAQPMAPKKDYEGHDKIRDGMPMVRCKLTAYMGLKRTLTLVEYQLDREEHMAYQRSIFAISSESMFPR
jgi:hypothetical protein